MELPKGSLAKVTPKGYLLIQALDFTIYGRDSLRGGSGRPAARPDTAAPWMPPRSSPEMANA